MSANSIVVYDDGTFIPGSKRHNVALSAAGASIKVGEFVMKTLGNASVKALVVPGIASTVKPSVGSDYLAGLATGTSTETTAAAGTVDVMPIMTGMTFLVSPAVAATYGVGSSPVQATYDALVGARVLLTIATTGVVTLLASDSANNGLVVEPMDVFLHQGKVRVSVRQALMYTN
jgi:hypothetical protein